MTRCEIFLRNSYLVPRHSYLIHMSIQEFNATLSLSDPPAGLSPLLQALWYDANGNWDAAHDVAQDVHSPQGSWVHAYLHRKEGDPGNASYWYHRANKPMSQKSLKDEWTEIVSALLLN
jgi:hypothetical protein